MINEKLYHKARDRAVQAENFHLTLFGLKKCKTKGSDGQPSMYIYISPRGRAEKAAEIQDNSFVSRSWHELASCQGLTKKPD